MAETMWDDVKKLSDLLYTQTKEQKDILLLKLRLASFSSKRETAFARMGSLVYKPLKDGKKEIAENREIRNSLNELIDIEKDIAKTEKELEELRSVSADKRTELGDKLGKTWEKTKKAVKAQVKPSDEPVKTKSKAKAGSTAASEKTAKRSKPKSGGGKTVKDKKKGSAESDKS